MAKFRESPECLFCGEKIEPKYLDQSNTPTVMQLIGDTFIGWDWENHTCDEAFSQNKCPFCNLQIKDCKCSDEQFFGKEHELLK